MHPVNQETADVVVAKLEAGDTVGVYPASDNLGTTTSLKGSGYNTFCGHLLATYMVMCVCVYVCLCGVMCDY